MNVKVAVHCNFGRGKKGISIHKLLLIVPAYNEEESLPATLEILKAQPFDFVIIDDGSKDHTAQIAKQAGAALVRLPFNQGLAGAFLAGMQYAASRGYSYAMQFDADGQHLPQYIGGMLQRIQESGADVLIGSRFLNAPMPRGLRTVGSRLIRTMVHLTTGKRLTDPTSGMRLYNSKMIRLFAARFDLTPEPDTMAYLMRSGAVIEEYPVTMRERTAGASYLTTWSAVRYMSRMAFSILMVQFARERITVKEDVRI